MWNKFILQYQKFVDCYYTFFFTLYYSFITESPRWLLAKGRTKEAMTILQKVAKMNKRKLDLDADEIKMHEEQSEPFMKSLKSLLSSCLLIRRLLVLAFCLYVFLYQTQYISNLNNSSIVFLILCKWRWGIGLGLWWLTSQNKQCLLNLIVLFGNR